MVKWAQKLKGVTALLLSAPTYRKKAILHLKRGFVPFQLHTTVKRRFFFERSTLTPGIFESSGSSETLFRILLLDWPPRPFQKSYFTPKKGYYAVTFVLVCI